MNAARRLWDDTRQTVILLLGRKLNAQVARMPTTGRCPRPACSRRECLNTALDRYQRHIGCEDTTRPGGQANKLARAVDSQACLQACYPTEKERCTNASTNHTSNQPSRLSPATTSHRALDHRCSYFPLHDHRLPCTRSSSPSRLGGAMVACSHTRVRRSKRPPKRPTRQRMRAGTNTIQ